MKCAWVRLPGGAWLSLPVREVWIEILDWLLKWQKIQSLPVREVWIEIFYCSQAQKSLQKSLPVREVWIEISALPVQSMRSPVTSREGSVD